MHAPSLLGAGATATNIAICRILNGSTMQGVDHTGSSGDGCVPVMDNWKVCAVTF
jgi:hypothetical protein